MWIADRRLIACLGRTTNTHLEKRRTEKAMQVNQVERLDTRLEDANPAEPSRPTDEPLHVLMVEDDPDYFRFVRALLTRRGNKGFAVVHAANLKECAQQLSLENPDAILLDLHLPDSAGLETLTRVRELCGSTPIIILTGADEEKFGLEAVAQGAHDYLLKHRVGDDSLIRCIRYAIARRTCDEATFRFAMIQDFTSMLAHDLKVPLIGSKNVLAAMARDQYGEMPAPYKSLIDSLSASNQDLLTMVDKLIEVYKYEGSPALKFKPMDVVGVIDGCIQEIKSKCENASFVTNIGEHPAVVFADQAALQALFANVLGNACKFHTNGTAITVTGELSKSKIAVHIHNFGPPMPPSVRSNDFHKFWNGVPGKNYVARAGLGLHLCHRIANLHRGRITCKSSFEEGTTVTVRLPLIADSMS